MGISSIAWGRQSYDVGQGFGPENTQADPSWYIYSENYGFPPGVHIGLDVGVPKMTPIYALSPGTVIQAGMSDSFRPKPVWIEAQDNPATPDINETGYVEIYGHLWESTVSEGMQVTPGQQIGFSGEQTIKGTMTPDGSGPHIHFELRVPDASTPSGYRAVDPTNYLQGRGGIPLTNTSNLGSVPGVSDISGVLNDVGGKVVTLAQRTMLVAIGMILLGVGVNSLLGNPAGNVISKAVDIAL